MNEDEMESFEINSFDLQNEFNNSGRTKGLSKEQQIYGMWALNSDDEEAETPQKSILRNNYSQQMSFVSAGLQKSEKERAEEAAKDPKSDEDEEEDRGPRPMFKGSVDSSDEEDTLNPRMPLSASSSRQMLRGTNDMAGFRKKTPALFKEGGVGEWERHTSGIGSKLMKMMGYKEGKGLGKNLQGISTPVEAQKRKGKGAIGYYGTERSDRSIKDFPVEDDEKEENLKFEKQLQRWKKNTNKEKTKYVFKSAEEVILEGKSKKTKTESDNHITKHKVIDMTGPETRILSSYHAIGGQQKMLQDDEDADETEVKKQYEHFDLPELIHNLQILLERSENDIIQSAKTVEREENRIVHLNHERERYEILVGREEKELEGLDQALALIESLEAKHTEKSLTLSEAETTFTILKNNYLAVYHNFEVVYLAPTYLTPLLKDLFSKWNPLSNPCQHLELMVTWQQLLEKDGSQMSQQPLGDQPMDPYHQILWDTWAAALRSTIMGPWEPKDCMPLLQVLDTWVPPIIPVWIQSHILQNVCLPRITRAVHNWSPMQDTVPIHTWLHPWLPLLSEHLQGVYPVIRQKLSSALVHWHAADRSAKMVLQPWKGVFSDVSMTTLMQVNIQPKIESALMEMTISPQKQNLDAWHWFLDWDDMMPFQIVLDILERCFFPRWYQALGGWLSANPPYFVVVAWYNGWRELIPSSLSNHSQVKQKLLQALEICKRALSHQSGAADTFGSLISSLDKLSQPPPPPAISPPAKKGKGKGKKKNWADIISGGKKDTLSMKELVEKRCLEKEIVFLPLRDKTHEGRPIYKCGSLNISFNKNIIYVQMERGWMPKSLTTLIDDA